MVGFQKLIVPFEKNESKAIFELYDLEKDPLESANLVEQFPDRVAELRLKLDNWWTPESIKP